MIRILATAAIALLVAACASNPPVNPQVVYRGVAPSAPVYQPSAAIPQPTAADGLRVCGGTVSNAGYVGLNGEVLEFTPWIQTDRVTLLRNPTEGACLSSGYGWRARATGGGKDHNGIDLANAGGGAIFAAADGLVLAVGWRGDYGLTVEIDHGAGVRTLYAHLSETVAGLARGSRAWGGMPIGRMGATGNATGVHLHYEVSVDGWLVNPLNWGAPAPLDGPIS